MYSEKACLLCILKVHGLGIRRLEELRKRIGSYRGIWLASTEQISEIVGTRLANGLRELKGRLDPDEELGRCLSLGMEVLAHFEPGFPASLAQIPSPPPIIFCRGDVKCLEKPAVAVVGARKATPYGRMVARKLGRDLARANLVVVSGVARGIDSEAHWGCLEGGGMTIGVLGNGLDVVYPRENRTLYSRIERQGLLLSEYPPGTAPEPGNFPVRNRLISALSRGVVVVEAQQKSGAMITVGFALEQGKDVFAVPGPVTSPNSQGPHMLLKEGARLVDGVEDILQEWGIETRVEPGREKVDAKSEIPVYDYIGFEPIHLDRILEISGLTVADTAPQLLQLELQGKIKCLPGNIYVRV